MNPLDTIKNIINKGRSGVLFQSSNPLLRQKPKTPVFGIPKKPAMPVMPSTANTTRQTVKPVALQAPVVPPPPIDPLEIIRNGKNAVLRAPQGTEATATTRKDTPINRALFGSERDRAAQLAAEQRGVKVPFTAKMTSGGILGTIAPSLARTPKERQEATSQALIEKGIDPDRAIEIAYYKDMSNGPALKTQAEMTSSDEATKALKDLKLTPQEKNVLLKNKLFNAGESALDIGTFGVGGTVRNVGKGAIKTVLKGAELDIAEQAIDIARGTSKLDKEVQAEVLKKAQDIADRELFPNQVGGTKALANDFEAALQNKATKLTDEPKIRTKVEVSGKDVAGNKFTVPAGTKIVPQTDGKKFLITVDGKQYTIPKNQYDNLKGQSDISIATKFAPELEGTVETVKGAKKTGQTKASVRSELEAKGIFIDKDMSGEANLVDKNGELIDYDNLSSAQRDKVDYVIGDSETYNDIAEADTKYSQYTLDGGKNYREILIQAPSRDNSAYVMVNKGSGKPIGEYQNLKEAQAALSKQDNKTSYYIEPKGGGISEYKSSHWSEPNVISHIRMNERTIDGKKYAFMEELQSDWARDARAKEGIPNNPLLKDWQIPTTKRALIEAVDSGADRFAWINGEQTSARYNLATHVDNVSWRKAFDPDATHSVVEIMPKSGEKIKLNVAADGKVMGGKSEWNGKKLDEVLGKGLADKIMEKETGTLSGDGLSFGGEWAKNLYDKQVRDIVKRLTGAEVKTVDMGLGKGKNTDFTINDGRDAGGMVAVRNLDVGLDIADSKGTGFIITEVGEGGKFKAIQKSSLDENQKGYGLPKFISNLKAGIEQPNVKQNQKEFNIGKNAQTQQYINLTPEVKARIQSEAPKFKLADFADSERVPLIFRQFLDDTKATRNIDDVIADLKAIFKTDNIPLVGVKEFAEDPRKLGEMREGVIRILQMGDKVSDVVAKHESWHLFKNGMVTKSEKAFIKTMEADLLARSPKKVAVLRQRGYKESDLAEELMADEFAIYYRTGVTFSEKLAALFDRIIQRLEMILVNKTEVLTYFKNVSSKTTGKIKGNSGPVKSKINPIDTLIAANKVRVVSRDGRDVYQVKKGGAWKSVRDEDSAIKQASPVEMIAKPKQFASDATEQRVVAAEIAKEALDANPAKELARYVSKRGDSKGQIAEVTGKQGSKTGIGVDVRVADLGFNSTEEARDAYNAYKLQKERVTKELAEAKKLKSLELKQKAPQPEPQFRSVLNSPTPVPKAQVAGLEKASRPSIEEARPLTPYKADSLQDIITKTPLEQKVNIVDYLRTPDRVLNKIGFGKEAKLLRDQYEKYSQELPKNIDKITDWLNRVPEKGASERIFQHLDGKTVKLSVEEQKVADEIRVYLKDWADRLGLPEENRVANYITRLFDDQLIKQEFDEDLAKIISGKIPGEVYNPFLQKRLGAKGYKQDVWGALDAYTKRATRKVHLDPALERIRDKAGASLEFTNLEESQFQYIQQYIDRVQMRPTKIDNAIDNTVKQVLGYKFGQRPVTTISRFLRRATYRGMLGGNLSSALRNLSQGVNTYAVLGEKYTAIGYAKLLQPAARKELIEQGIFNNNFIEDRVLSSTKKILQKGDKALWFFFDQAEKINRGSAYLGAKAKGIGMGMNEQEAINYAKSIVRKTQFSYDAVDQPVALGSDILKTLFQFQTYTTKQTEFLSEIAKGAVKGDKKMRNVISLLRYGLAGYAFVNTVGKALGMTMGEMIPLYQNITGERELSAAPSLKFPIAVGKAALDTPDKYGNDRDLEEKMKDVGKSVVGLIPGGSQIKKTYEGYKAVQEGGSFDAAGRKQFDQGTSTASKVQSILFGKYANQNAKDYFDKKTTTGNKDLDQAKKEDQANQQVRAKKAAQIVTNLDGKSSEEVVATLKELYKTDRAMYDKVMDKVQEKKNNWSKEDKAIADLGVTSGARAQYVKAQAMKLTPEERVVYLKDLYDRKVISKEVLKQISESK